MIKKILFVFLGVLIGGLSMFAFNNYNRYEYFELQKDYYIDGVQGKGVLKKGTQIKFEDVDNRFSRYVLYLNIMDYEELKPVPDDGSQNNFK